MALAATLAAWVGSVAGTGGTAVLLPVLVFFLLYGLRRIAEQFCGIDQLKDAEQRG
jgi:predicted PurR-regulated permease PerM